VDIACLEKHHLMDVMFPLPVNDHTPHSEVPFAIRVLQGMAELPKFIQEVWPVWSPTYDSLLSAIYNHVHKETKHGGSSWTSKHLGIQDLCLTPFMLSEGLTSQAR